ncbi:MAG: UDP-N-acetylmuramoyl-L-alanine--D-glutamate ligase [Patescibacteria group bacterium]|nr:UDP-N-acetylmuramoyl-L-alanine--D-glutamate ligase [Patescibacteria group bacterium]
MIWKNKKITMLGLGVLGRGVGVAKFLAEQEADLIITDLKSERELQSSLKRLKKYKNIQYVLGKHRISDFRNRDFIIKAAGVPLDSIYIQEARKNKIPIEMDASFFAKLSNARIIGVTGTRGKSTVTHLLYEIFKKNGSRVFLGGNVKGLATLPLLKKVKEGDIVLMELDSWQLQGFGEAKISPSVSVFTNFLDDHLNYYKNNRQKYFSDKANIFRYQKKDDSLIVSRQANKEIKKYFKGKIKSKILLAGDFNLPKEWRIKILGKHNLRNIALAVKAAQVLGVKKKIIKKAVEEFKGVPGRLKFIRKFKGVEYYNDTTSTMPDAAIAALKSFLPKKARESNIILIGGGADKSLNYKSFVEELKGRAKALILFKGAATDKIMREIKKMGFGCEYGTQTVDSMKNALNLANEYARKGDIVLLSPGAASFGVFKNEFDRGAQFCKIVMKLK